MRRIRLLALSAAVIGLAAALSPATAETTTTAADQWATIKGQVVLPANVPVPERKKLDVSQDKTHCLSKGDILDESLIVNPKDRGIKNVVVWLRPDNTNPKSGIVKAQIFPDDTKRKPATVTIDQPCCMFNHHITVVRVGDTIQVKNPAPVAHNFFWSSANNGEYNVTVAKESDWKMPVAIKGENSPIQFKCTIHPWMSGYVRVFDHPYYAVTDENGNFEIKNAPVGKFRLVYWQEGVGFKGGAPGRFGEPITIAAPATELKPTEFNVLPKK